MTDKEAIDLKKLIHAEAISSVIKRINTAQAAIDGAIESKANETKSTAGDKFETGRAMLQIEQEKNEMQRDKAQATLELLESLSIENRSDRVSLGSMVSTSNGIYYIAVGIGKLTMDDIKCYVISPASPIGSLMIGLKVGESHTFRGKKFFVESIH